MKVLKSKLVILVTALSVLTQLSGCGEIDSSLSDPVSSDDNFPVASQVQTEEVSEIKNVRVQTNAGPDFLNIVDDNVKIELSDFLSSLKTLEPIATPEFKNVPKGVYVNVMFSCGGSDCVIEMQNPADGIVGVFRDNQTVYYRAESSKTEKLAEQLKTFYKNAYSSIHTFSGITKIEVRRNDTPEYLDVTSDELSKKLSEFVEYLSTLEPASPPENEDSPAGSYVDVKIYDSKGTHQLYFPYTGSNRVNYKVCMSDSYTFADEGKIEEIADYLKDVCGEAAK